MDDKLTKRFKEAKEIQISLDVADQVMEMIGMEKHARKGPVRFLLPALAGILSIIVIAMLFRSPPPPRVKEHGAQQRIVVISGCPRPLFPYPDPAAGIRFAKLMKGGYFLP